MELNQIDTCLGGGAPFAAWALPKTHERTTQPAAVLRESVVSALLNEVDYGVILLNAEGQVAFINRAARNELRTGGCIDVVDGHPRARHSDDASRLAVALAGARRGLRRLVTMTGGTQASGTRRELAFVPMATESGVPCLIAVLFGRRRLCEPISVQCFARANGLTPAELRVLELLCEGLDPRAIADINEVGLATVRTQVYSIRDKTGAASIRALIERLAMLPPMVSSLGF
jgi:DNA-binding CsgD family transcriptional regulator